MEGVGVRLSLRIDYARLLFYRAAATLDFHHPRLLPKRSTRTLSVLGSPILSPPAVVGEFKGWFSNLFSWKPHTQVLYASSNVGETHSETARVLTALGIILALEDGVLRCRTDDGAEGTRVRFRVEFTDAAAGQCVIALVQEKGAVAVFRGVCRRLREEWKLGEPLQSTEFSGGTPTLEPVGRWVEHGLALLWECCRPRGVH